MLFWAIFPYWFHAFYKPAISSSLFHRTPNNTLINVFPESITWTTQKSAPHPSPSWGLFLGLLPVPGPLGVVFGKTTAAPFFSLIWLLVSAPPICWRERGKCNRNCNANSDQMWSSGGCCFLSAPQTWFTSHQERPPWKPNWHLEIM